MNKRLKYFLLLFPLLQEYLIFSAEAAPNDQKFFLCALMAHAGLTQAAHAGAPLQTSLFYGYSKFNPEHSLFNARQRTQSTGKEPLCLLTTTECKKDTLTLYDSISGSAYHAELAHTKLAHTGESTIVSVWTHCTKAPNKYIIPRFSGGSYPRDLIPDHLKEACSDVYAEAHLDDRTRIKSSFSLWGRTL